MGKSGLTFQIKLFIISFFLSIVCFSSINGQRLITISPQYKYYSGNLDSLSWTSLDFDASGWANINSDSFPSESWTSIGLFRFTITVDSTQWRKPLGLTVSFNGALELYLDGVLMQKTGEVGESILSEIPYFYSFPDVFPIAISPKDTTINRSQHVIAIRYSSHFLKKSIWEGFSPGFFFHIGNLNNKVNIREAFIERWTTHQVLLVGIAITFTLLHLTLFLFYRYPRANLYFALATLGYAINIFFDVQNFFEIIPEINLWNDRLNYAGSFLLVISIILITYSMYYEKRPRLFWGFLAIGSIMVIFSWFRPFASQTIGKIFILLTILEIIRVFVFVFLKKLKPRLYGSWIIAFGLIPFLLAFIYEQFVEFGVLSPAFPIDMVDTWVA